MSRSRRRLYDTGNAAEDHDSAATCSVALDEDVDQNTHSLYEINRRILAYIIMIVVVNDVLHPAKVNNKTSLAWSFECYYCAWPTARQLENRSVHHESEAHQSKDG